MYIYIYIYTNVKIDACVTYVFDCMHIVCTSVYSIGQFVNKI